MSRSISHAFAPVPKVALSALAAGAIDRDDLAILCFLWNRTRLETYRAQATLAQLAVGIGWKKTEDALSKRVRKLASKGWFERSTKPGEHGAWHVFDMPATGLNERSEDVPRSDDAGVPRSDEPLTRSAPALASEHAEQRSEEAHAVEAAPVLRKSLSVPRSEQGAEPLAESDCDAEPTASVLRRSEVKKTLRTKESSEVCFSSYDPAVGEGARTTDRLLEGVKAEQEQDGADERPVFPIPASARVALIGFDIAGALLDAIPAAEERAA